MTRAIAFALASAVAGLAFAEHAAPTYKTLQLSDEFHSEGASFGDFNKDGRMDVVSGPYWWEGPDFQKKRQIYKPTGKQQNGTYKPDNEYSDNFFAFTHDFNGDGWTDYLILGFPGADSRWYQNPGEKVGDEKVGDWKRNQIFDVTDNESPTFGDFTGDGKPEIIFHSKGYLGYAEPIWNAPEVQWRFTPVSKADGRFQRFTHGFGWGDVNKDGRNDILEARGWWEQPAEKGKLFNFHPYHFANGGAQMHVYDVDGDGDNDVITSLNAHGYGLAWHEQKKKDDGTIGFSRHDILTDKPDLKSNDLRFSQLHAVDLIDINGDGLKDIVTGKRWYAHGSKGDAEPTVNPVVYWFELKRDSDKGVQWIPHLIHDNSGIGTQVVAGDINGDKIPDIVVGNKKGTFVSLSQPSGPVKAASR